MTNSNPQPAHMPADPQPTGGEWRATQGLNQMCDPGTTICTLRGWGIYSDADEHGDAEADARLIAACPALLNALQLARELLDLEGYEEQSPSMQAIDAALALATGKQA